MTIIRWSFYSRETGLFSGSYFESSIDAIDDKNVPDDHRAIKGNFDHLSQRAVISSIADPDTGELIDVVDVEDYQPPQPSPDYEWIHDDANGNRVRRWQLTKEAQAINHADAQARGEIARLEAQQLRVIREAAIGYDGAQQRLKDIDDRIIALRKNLKR